MAAALAAIPQVDTGKTFSIGAGTGHFKGETALSVGGSVRIIDNAVIKAGVSYAGDSDCVVNAGVAYSW